METSENKGQNESKLQRMSVLIGAIFTTLFYVILRCSVLELTFIDKFWCSVPIFSSLIITDRCIIKRFFNLVFTKKIKV